MSNDTFRKFPTPLSEEQKERVFMCKDFADILNEHFDLWVPKEERSERSRCMAIARTNLEQAVMWAVKGLTTDVH